MFQIRYPLDPERKRKGMILTGLYQTFVFRTVVLQLQILNRKSLN